MASDAVRLLVDPQPIVRGARSWTSYAKFFRDPVAFLMAHRALHGPLFALGDPLSATGSKRKYIFALGPDYNERILGDVTGFRTSGIIWNGPLGSALHHMRYGLTRMNGATHRRHRQLLTPKMMRLAVNGHCEQMTFNAVSLLDDWTPGTSLDLFQEMRRLSLRLTTLMLFSRDDLGRAERLSEMIRRFMQQSSAASTWMLPFNVPGSNYRRMFNTAEEIGAQLRAMIQRRYSQPTPDGDILDLLISANQQQDAQFDLLGHAFVLFVGSYENIATTLSWTLFLLAQHPKVMTALHSELISVLRGRTPSADQLDHLPLLDGVLNESLRLLPPVIYLLRIATQPTQVGRLSVDEGDRVICSPYVTHHLPELFSEPERFDPWRWQRSKPRSNEFLPFGVGPRTCIGKSFATTAIKMALTLICQRWRIEVTPHSRIDRGSQLFLMFPKSGIPVVVHRQDGRFNASPVTGSITESVDLQVGRSDPVPSRAAA